MLSSISLSTHRRIKDIQLIGRRTMIDNEQISSLSGINVIKPDTESIYTSDLIRRATKNKLRTARACQNSSAPLDVSHIKYRTIHADYAVLCPGLGSLTT